jgi:hypothetical protein
MALAAFALASGNTAHARLGWTLDECQKAWGKPIYTAHTSEFDLTCYTFNLGTNLTAKAYLLNGHVQAISYLSLDKKFLLAKVKQLLHQNSPGVWTPYDDKRDKETVGTWQYLNSDDEMTAYAVLWANPDVDGTYNLQISSNLWNAYLSNRNVNSQF